MSSSIMNTLNKINAGVQANREERIRNAYAVEVKYTSKIDYLSINAWLDEVELDYADMRINEQTDTITVYFDEEENAMYFDKVKHTLLFEYDLEGERGKYTATVLARIPVHQTREIWQWLCKYNMKPNVLRHELVGKGMQYFEIELGFDNKLDATQFKLRWG